MAIQGFSLPGAQHSTAASCVRQVRALLTPPPSDAASLHALAASLAATRLLASLHAAAGSDDDDGAAALASLTRLATLAAAHLAAPPHAGAALATQLLRADAGSSHADAWASACVAALLALSEGSASARTRRATTGVAGVQHLLALAAQLLGQEAHAEQRPEYRRAVVAPNAPRFAMALTALLERAGEDAGLVVPVCDALSASLHHHASLYRPHAPRLHAVVSALLYGAGLCGRAQAAVVRLAAALHRTGAAAKGKGSATGGPAELWSAGVAAPIAAARISAAAMTNTFGATQQMAGPRDPGLFEPLPADEAEAVPLALTRLELLLGTSSSRGILPLYLAQGSATRVALPLATLLALSLDLLALGAAPQARAPPPDASLLALQSAMLPRAQEAALRLLAAVLTCSTREALIPHAPTIVSCLVTLIEEPHLAPRTRCSATRTLALALARGQIGSGIAGAALPLDPASPLVLSTARAMLLLLARFITHSSSSFSDPSTTTARKKRKYESDAVSLGAAAHTALVQLSPDDVASGRAALDVLTALTPLLSSDLTPAHHSLRHTHALLLLSLATLSMDSVRSSPCDNGLATHLLSALSSLIVDSDGALLALLLARTTLVVAAASRHARADVQRAGAALQGAVEMILDPRLPPRLGLATEELPQEWAGEGSTKVELASDGTRQALDVLGIKELDCSDAPTSTSTEPLPASRDSITSPLRAPPLEHSMEPTKPVRAHTPRIGSPAASPERASSGNNAVHKSPARSIFPSTGSGSPRQMPLDAPTSSNSAATADRMGSPLGPRALATPAAPAPVVNQTTTTTTTTTTVQVEPELDDEDEEMPEIDLRGSDEESESE